jgi:DNA-binding transcriptional LysR family regulator
VHGEPTEITHLYDHKLIVFDSNTPNMEWRFNGLGRLAIRSEPRLLTNDVETAIAAALGGVGIARVMSYQVHEHVVKGRLKYVLKNFEPPPSPVNLVFQGSRRRTPNLVAFIAATQEYLRGRSLG